MTAEQPAAGEKGPDSKALYAELVDGLVQFHRDETKNYTLQAERHEGFIGDSEARRRLPAMLRARGELDGIKAVLDGLAAFIVAHTNIGVDNIEGWGNGTPGKSEV